MTQSPDNPVALYGSRLLDNLSSDEKHKNKNAIRQEGGLVPLVSLLRMVRCPFTLLYFDAPFTMAPCHHDLIYRNGD